MRTSVRRSAAPLVVVLASAWLAAGCDVSVGVHSNGLRYVERETRDFQVAGTPDITLSTFDGAIEIRAWDRSEVSIEIEKRGPNKEAVSQIEVKATQSGDRITLKVQRPNERASFGFSTSVSARVIASVPRQANVDAQSNDGAISIERVAGTATLNTRDGSVKAAETSGDLRVHTGDGSIALERVDGRVNADTIDGSITLDGRLEGVRLKTSDGSIRVRAGAGSRMADDWDIQTADGSVTIDVPEPFDADLDAHTGDGTVSVGSLTVKGAVSMSRRSVRGQLGSGGRSLRISTGDGWITISRS
jgi:DUF4097 and DUF4098 domain-containing protein YvlB